MLEKRQGQGIEKRQSGSMLEKRQGQGIEKRKSGLMLEKRQGQGLEKRQSGSMLEKNYMETKTPIRNFYDLDVYKGSYKAMLLIFKEILPQIPKEEKFDLKDQLRRSSKAVPRLIAEGYAKRQQIRGFKKYLDDALAESNETIVSLNQYRDLYCLADNFIRCNEIIDMYDKTSRQLYKLSFSWITFNKLEKKEV